MSHALENHSKCEFLWLVYLKSYLAKRNSLNDYHEVCMLCMDNLLTYDVVWFIINTCPVQYVDMIVEKYERFLLVANSIQLDEFEQSFDDLCTQSQSVEKTSRRVSYYLFELIIFHVYTKLNEHTAEFKTCHEAAKKTLNHYLNTNEVTLKLEPIDLTLLWLCAIHLEVYLHLPGWLSASNFLASKTIKNVCRPGFWAFRGQKRIFNERFFKYVNLMYASSTADVERNYDLFLITWRQTQLQQQQQTNSIKYACSIEHVHGMFHQALKSINVRNGVSATSSLATKQATNLHSLSLLVNFINLETANSRFEVASKMSERLLKSADKRMLKELWFTNVHIFYSQLNTNSTNLDNLKKSIEQSVDASLKCFPLDAQVAYISAQYYSSIVS